VRSCDQLSKEVPALLGLAKTVIAPKGEVTPRLVRLLPDQENARGGKDFRSMSEHSCEWLLLSRNHCWPVGKMHKSRSRSLLEGFHIGQERSADYEKSCSHQRATHLINR
jgi:hypothetical protein